MLGHAPSRILGLLLRGEPSVEARQPDIVRDDGSGMSAQELINVAMKSGVAHAVDNAIVLAQTPRLLKR